MYYNYYWVSVGYLDACVNCRARTLTAETIIVIFWSKLKRKYYAASTKDRSYLHYQGHAFICNSKQHIYYLLLVPSEDVKTTNYQLQIRVQSRWQKYRIRYLPFSKCDSFKLCCSCPCIRCSRKTNHDVHFSLFESVEIIIFWAARLWHFTL